MQGFNVLSPMGWDSSGCRPRTPPSRPASPAGVHRAQIPRMKTSPPPRRRVRLGPRTRRHTPEYYRWDQWLFLELYERGWPTSARPRSTGARPTRPCSPTSRWSTARCERCGLPVVKRDLDQWFFKITDYAQRCWTISMLSTGPTGSDDAAQLDRPLGGLHVLDGGGRTPTMRSTSTRPVPTPCSG
jgi:leucyl-tRNA synthetase